MVGGLDKRHAFKCQPEWGYLGYEAMKPMKDAHDIPICFIPVPWSCRFG